MALHPLIYSSLRGKLLPDSALPIAISLVFGGIVWALRAATPGGVAAGILICLTLLLPPAVAVGQGRSFQWTALVSLTMLFVLSFAATRFRRARKETAGLAESRRGRRASQIVANLGAAALFAAMGSHVGCIAALAEAAADTTSSEIGQSLGGPVRLITTLQLVAPGTDGGITFRGTLAGIISAIVVVMAGNGPGLQWHSGIAMFLAASAGLFFDSLVGATVERKGWMGNDLVNFSSTVFAGLLAIALSHILFRSS